jgi:isopropylmalate/homocitrate/citramalate synthase
MTRVALPGRVRLIEVGPRDGLQNEPVDIPTEAKIHFVDLLSAAGCGTIEVTSFVHPRAVPRMADADRVLPAIEHRPGTRYVVLVPNLRGLERALAAGGREIALFTAATESFARANINRTIAESLEDARAVIHASRPLGVRVRAYISVAFGCPFEGRVTPDAVAVVAERLLELGADEIGIGDTIGVATPADVHALMDRLGAIAPLEKWGMHFHDTRGTALMNVLASLEDGVTTFDSSAGGLGGCPFAGPNAAGNVATEDLVYALDGMGIEHGVDLDGVLAASRYISAYLDHPLRSRVYQAGGRLVPQPRSGA